MENTHKAIIFLAVSPFIIGCDDDKKKNKSNSPNGIYSGSISGGNAGLNGNERAIIYQNRMIVFSTTNNIRQVFDSTIATNSSKKNIGGVTDYFNITTSTPALMTFSGSYDPGKSVTGTFTDSNNTPVISPATINLSANSTLYNTRADKSITTGTWTGTYGTNAETMTIAINSDGIFTGSDTEVCNYTGTVYPTNTRINVYKVTLNNNVNTGCNSLTNNKYDGLAWIEGNNNTLIFSVSDGNNNRTIILNKQ